jgi:hypothetical protein
MNTTPYLSVYKLICLYCKHCYKREVMSPYIFNLVPTCNTNMVTILSDDLIVNDASKVINYDHN